MTKYSRCKIHFNNFSVPDLVSLLLKCQDFEKLKEFPRKYVKRCETTGLLQTFASNFTIIDLNLFFIVASFKMTKP